MAWVHEQSTGTSPAGIAGSIAQAFGSNVKAGGLMVVSTSWGDGTPASPTISDSLGTSWTQIASNLADAGDVQSFAAFYGYAPSAGANTITATYDTTYNFRSLVISEYSGVTGTAVATTSRANGNFGTGADAATSNSAMTPTAAGQLVWGGINVTSNACAFTPGTGFAERFETTANQHEHEDRSAPSTSALQVFWTLGTASTNTQILGAIFAETVTATPFIPHRMPLGV